MKRLIRLWLPPLVWIGLIYLVSAQQAVPSVPGVWDLLLKKAAHVLAYGVLAALYLRATRGSSLRDRPARVISASLAVGYALSDEYHQMSVPGRNGTYVDVVIDALGVAGAILLDWRARAGCRGQQGTISQ